jgi:hypothetical protein
MQSRAQKKPPAECDDAVGEPRTPLTYVKGLFRSRVILIVGCKQ